MAGKARRTTLRSSKGKKLYAVRDKNGTFKDIQTYQRAHSADMRRKSKAEIAKAAKAANAVKSSKATKAAKPAKPTKVTKVIKKKKAVSA